MIIHNFDFVRMAFLPAKTDAPLVVDPDAVLPQPTALQGFQAITRRHSHLAQFRSGVQGEQLAPCASLNRRRESTCNLRPEEAFGLCAREAQDRGGLITRCVKSVKASHLTRAKGSPGGYE